MQKILYFAIMQVRRTALVSMCLLCYVTVTQVIAVPVMQLEEGESNQVLKTSHFASFGKLFLDLNLPN